MLHNRCHIQLTVQQTLKYSGYYKKSCLKSAMTLCKLAEIRICEICEVTRHEAGFNLLIHCETEVHMHICLNTNGYRDRVV